MAAKYFQALVPGQRYLVTAWRILVRIAGEPRLGLVTPGPMHEPLSSDLSERERLVGWLYFTAGVHRLSMCPAIPYWGKGGKSWVSLTSC